MKLPQLSYEVFGLAMGRPVPVALPLSGGSAQACCSSNLTNNLYLYTVFL